MTDGRTDRIAISKSRVSIAVLTRDEKQDIISHNNEAFAITYVDVLIFNAYRAHAKSRYEVMGAVSTCSEYRFHEINSLLHMV